VIWLRPLLGSGPFFPPFTLAVIAAAWYGRRGPGIAVTVIGAAMNAFFKAPPIHSFAISSTNDGIRVALFVIGGALISVLPGSRKEAWERLADQMEWQRVTMTSMGDAVLVTDTDGRITYTNPIAQKVLRRPSGELTGKPRSEVFPVINEETRQTVANPVTKVLQSGAIVGLANHTILLLPNGAEVPIDNSAAPVRDSHGRVIGVVLLFRDVTAQRQAEKTSQAQTDRLKLQAAMLDQAYDAIFARDLEQHIIYWNPACESLYGWSRDEALGKNAHQLLRTEFPIVHDTLEAVLQPDGHWEGEITHTSRDGTRRTESSRHILVRDTAGEPQAILEINRDITARKRTERELERLLEEAETANTAKDEFLATLSHELRTPLNAILGWSQMLAGSTPDPEMTRRGLDAIARNARAQAQLVADVLDVSRIITGKLLLNVKNIDLHGVVASTLETVRPAADAKRVRLT
jgi:PAS domain S-box-containing protein